MMFPWAIQPWLRASHFVWRVRVSLGQKGQDRDRARRVRADFYEHVWRDAAGQLGASVRDLGSGILEIERDQIVTRVRQNYTQLDDSVTLAVAGDKPLSFRLLEQHRVTIPRYAQFTLATIDEATEFLASVGGDCVVKPAVDTGGGQGVTTGIGNQRRLYRAAALASAYGRELLIQEQIAGANYRLVFLNGKLLDAVEQSPPTVVGDGTSTIRGLLSQANADRLEQGEARAQKLLTEDLDMRHTLARQGLKFASVPKQGQSVILKTAINDNAGADNRTATGVFCESIRDEAKRAVDAIGSRLGGVDVITTDPSRPLEETGGAIIEVNTTPGFYWHYHKSDGPFSVALHVLTEIFTPDSTNVEQLAIHETGSPTVATDSYARIQNSPEIQR